MSQALEFARLTIPETNAAGDYTIVVGSNQGGRFTVEVSGDAAQGFDAAGLESRLKQLREEIKDVEARLKKLKDK